MVKMSLCVNNPTSQLIDVMIGNFTLALPCIADGNKDCLMYDIYIEGSSNFRKMAALSAENPMAVANFNSMATLCDAAYEDVSKATTPMEVTSRTCFLLQQLSQTMNAHGVTKCPLLPNILKIANVLAILKPKNLKSILSTPNNLKHLLNIKNLIQ